jgi:hypothetical protein
MLTVATEVRVVKRGTQKPKAVTVARILFFEMGYLLPSTIPFLFINASDQVRHEAPHLSSCLKCDERYDVADNLPKKLVSHESEVSARGTTAEVGGLHFVLGSLDQICECASS